jgi:hypothetical protein
MTGRELLRAIPAGILLAIALWAYCVLVIAIVPGPPA